MCLGCLLLFGLSTPLRAQEEVTDSLELPVFDYSEPQEYEIGGVKIEGAFFAEENAIIGVTGTERRSGDPDTGSRHSPRHQEPLAATALHQREYRGGENYR